MAGIQTIVADVTKQSDVNRMIDAAVEKYGKIDIICNVAGVMDRLLPVADVTDEIWQRLLAVNLTAPFMIIRRALPLMLKNGGGSIVNVASVGGLLGARGGAAYVASKHGVIGLTKNIACTYGTQGIRCVAVCPGPVETAIGLGGQPSEIGMAAFGKIASAMPRIAKPAEIANAILFAASNAASFVNGAALVVDGGWSVY